MSNTHDELYSYDDMLAAVHVILYERDTSRTKDGIIDAAKLEGFAKGTAEHYVAAVLHTQKPSKKVTVNSPAQSPAQSPGQNTAALAYVPYPAQSTIAPPAYGPKAQQFRSGLPDHPYNMRCTYIDSTRCSFPWVAEPPKCWSFCEPHGTGQVDHPDKWTPSQLGLYRFIDREFRENVEVPAEKEGLSAAEYVRTHQMAR